MQEGWYADPTGVAFKRWFDGELWTTATLDEQGRTGLDGQGLAPMAAASPQPQAAASYAWWWTVGPATVVFALLATTWDEKYTWTGACFLVAAGVALTRTNSLQIGLLLGLFGAGIGLGVRPLQAAIIGEGSSSDPGSPAITFRHLSVVHHLGWAVAVGVAASVLIVFLPALLAPARGRSLLGALVGVGVGVIPYAVIERQGDLSHGPLLYSLASAGLLALGALGVLVLGRPTLAA